MDDRRVGTSDEHLRAARKRFPSLDWGEHEWATALTACPDIMDKLGDSFVKLPPIKPPRKPPQKPDKPVKKRVPAVLNFQARRLGLSAQEVRVLRYITLGMSNPEIAQQMFLSQNTIKTHVLHLLRKFGAADRANLVYLGMSSGVI